MTNDIAIKNQEHHDALTKSAVSKPLVEHIYTADPSAHVFNARLYIYPSHDIESGVEFNDNGDHFNMEDYHVFSMDNSGGSVTDHGCALHIDDVPWAKRQMWAPDAAYSSGKYYLYFPAKNYHDQFQIGVAVADKPEGPFTAEPTPITGTYSIDPAVFDDTEASGSHYLYFGVIWGGQLQHYTGNQLLGGINEDYQGPCNNEVALRPRVAKLSANMKQLAEPAREIRILDERGNDLLAGDPRRYFEGPWLHKFNSTYYFSYSTGDHHTICYATSESPYGPFTYRGTILEPVVGWTTHHSICEFNNQWYLFYHDALLSGGVTHLRSIKMVPIHHDSNGNIQTISPYSK